MFRRMFLIGMMFLALSGCYGMNPPLKIDMSTNGVPPKLIDSYVVSAIWDGRMLPIFVEAKDDDGDLAGFRVEVSQLGGNMYDGFFIPVKKEDAFHVKGYLAMQIPKLDDIEYLRLNIYAVDRTGRRSRMVTHNVTIGFGKVSQKIIPDKWKDAWKNRLGNIFFDFQLEREDSSSVLFKE